MEDDSYIVYVLKNNYNNYTYVGITNNPERRIRQHNGEIKGGARYTTRLLCNNNKKETTKQAIWFYYGFILGLDKRTALSIEKKIHIHSRKYKGINPLEKRINCINNILKDYENLNFYTL